jgi:protein transport protein SEC9
MNLIYSIEKLANTERHLDIAKGHSQRADDRTDELKQLNRSIFRPVITFNKDGKRRAREQQLQERFEDERAERERGMQDIRETQNRLGHAGGRGEEDDEGLMGDGSGRRFKTQEQRADRKNQRARYQFEATASDDEVEDEIDDNLDQLGAAVAQMKALGITMGQEVDSQIGRIGRIEEKTTKLDNRVYRNTENVSPIFAHMVAYILTGCCRFFSSSALAEDACFRAHCGVSSSLYILTLRTCSGTVDPFE